MRPAQTYFNATLQIQAQWHSEPGTRGTFALLSSCLVTLFLCVWTAVHLNLPQHKSKHLQKWRKLKWLLIAAFAPEIVAWNAWEQRRQVNALTQEMRSLYRACHNPHGSLRPSGWSSRLKSGWDDVCHLHWLSRGRATMQHMWLKVLVCCMIRPGDLPEEPGFGSHHNADQPESDDYYWSDVHSWYALMGGYAFELSTQNGSYLPRDHERMVLTPDGLCKFYKYWPHLLPKVSQHDIEDKSKSDSLAKFLTCLQATWFCVQCISRYASGIPVSLLEINTVAHAVCSLTAYAFWWNKPKDLWEPTRIMGEDADAVATVLYTLSSIGSAKITRNNGRPSSNQARWLPCEPIATARCLPEATTVAVYRVDIPAPPLVILMKDRYWRLEFLRRPAGYQRIQPQFVQIGLNTISQLSLIKHHDELGAIDRDLIIGYLATNGLRPQKDLVVWRSGNLTFAGPDLFYVYHSGGEWTAYRTSLAYLVGYSFASLMYAGLHCIAWSGPFPSELERTLWRVSCSTIAIVGFLFTLCFSVISSIVLATGSWVAEVNNDWKSYGSVRKVKTAIVGIGFVLFITLSSLCFCCLVCFGFNVYLIGRIYLVVEGLRETLYLDARVLQTVPWSQYIPHIT